MIDQTIGQTFKRLRLSKNMSAKEVASEVLSYPQLMKFEKGDSQITVEKLFDALLHINISFKEFQRAYQTLSDSENLKFNGYLFMAFFQKNKAKLEALLKETRQLRILEPDKKRHRLNEIEIEALLYELDKDRQIPLSDIQFLSNYLLSVKEWSEYEIWLFTNTTNLYEAENLSQLVNQMLFPEDNLIWLAKNQRKKNLALLNVIKQLILQGDFKQSQKYLSYLRKQSLYDLDMHEKSLLVASEALFDLAQTPGNLSALKKYRSCLEALELFECFDSINFLTDFYQALHLPRFSPI